MNVDLPPSNRLTDNRGLHAPRPPTFPFSTYQNWRQKSALPFAVEIGCGVGYHPIQWANLNPNGQILAIERTKEKFKKFQRRLAHHTSLDNRIFAAHADASWLLPWLLEPLSVDEYFWLYPNPEPKRRNHRIAFSKLTELVVTTLKPNGRLTIATNLKDYADEIRRELPRRFGLKIYLEAVCTLDQAPRSHFEKKYLARGERCFNFEFTKISTSSTDTRLSR